MARLVFVVNNLDFLRSHRANLVTGARAHGYEVHVIGPAGAGQAWLDSLGVPFHPWQLERSGQRPRQEILAIARLVWLYRRLRPTLVHHVTVKPVLYGSLAARLTRVPAVVNAVSGLGYLFLAPGALAGVRRRAIARSYRMALGGPHTRVILQNDDDEAELRALGALGDARVVKIRGSGVDLAEFAETAPASAPLVVFPARLLKDKGVVEFVEAARLLRPRYPSLRMALVGGLDPGNPAGVTRAEVEAWVAEGVVEWWGHRADMAAVYREASIVALPSYREGMPRALLEAAAVGRAIITTDTPGCRDAVARGAVGLLVPVKSATELAAGLARYLDDPELRVAMGRAAARHARENFSQDVVLQQHLEVYADLERSTRFAPVPPSGRVAP